MKREILFRGKRIDSGAWVYGYFVKNPKGESLIHWRPFPEATSNTYHRVAPETVGQFTGLLDKQGTQIFEGDVVKQMDDDYSFTEGWETSDPRWEDKSLFDPMPQKEVMRDYVTLESFGYWLKSETFGYEGEGMVSPDDCVIIGNIHNNPNLLQ
jgi:hypothetical protein